MEHGKCEKARSETELKSENRDLHCHVIKHSKSQDSLMSRSLSKIMAIPMGLNSVRYQVENSVR
jgi:hypothetical protein